MTSNTADDINSFNNMIDYNKICNIMCQINELIEVKLFILYNCIKQLQGSIS